MSRVPAVKGGDQLGWFDTETNRFIPASPGVAYQRRCQANVELRDARSYFKIIHDGTFTPPLNTQIDSLAAGR